MFQPSDNLSTGINLAIMESERNGGLELKDIKVGQSFEVQTKHTLYSFVKRENNEYSIWGHPRYCPAPVTGHIHGSNYGGSMIRMGFIGVKMYLEMRVGEFELTTSQIQSVRLTDTHDTVM